MRRGDLIAEPEALRRGSRRSSFLTKENQNSGQSNANKTLWQMSSVANEFKNFGDYFREKGQGDSDIVIHKNRPKKQENIVTELSEKNSKSKMSVVVKMSHFGKLKKKNEDGMKKHHIVKSKNIEIQQIYKTIDKIQAKIDEFARAVQSLPKSKAVNDEKAEVVEKKAIVKKEAASVSSGERWTAAGVAVGIFIILLVILYLFEGETFFNFARHWKSPKPKSMFNSLSLFSS